MGIGENAEGELHSWWDTIEAVRVTMLKMGFSAARKPMFACPVVEARMLTGAPPDVYATIYAQNLAWQSYAADNLAILEGSLLQCKNEMDLLRNNIYREECKKAAAAGEKKPSDASIEREVMAHPRYQRLLHDQQEWSQSKYILRAAKETCENNISVLSRFVEFRKMEIDATYRRSGL